MEAKFFVRLCLCDQRRLEPGGTNDGENLCSCPGQVRENTEAIF